MKDVHGRLLERFLKLDSLTMVPEEERTKAFRALADKYAETHRKYHTLGHIDFCLEIFDRFRRLAKDPGAVEIAVFYHDAVYDIGVPSRQNEERSADMAAQVMGGWNLPLPLISQVTRIILATTHDRIVTDSDEQLMVDIDLAGLGGSWPVFLQNHQDVRQEYAQVPEALFREKNGEILQRFFDRTPLYYHPAIEARHGVPAKENLARWLTRS